MKLKNFHLGLCLLITNSLLSQTLTISSTGETGASGTNWSISSGTLTVTGDASISASVLQTEMLTSNLTIVPSVTSPYNLSVNINEAITSSTVAKSITIGSSLNDGIIAINQPITIDGAIIIFGRRVQINNDLTTTNTTSGNIIISAIENSTSNPGPISGTGNINIASGRDLFLNNKNLSTTSIYNGIISGTNSRLIVNSYTVPGGTYSGDGTVVLTQNNLYTGTTSIPYGTLILRNDNPNPASKNFTGANLKIEPTSTSFTNTFSTAGYTFGNKYSTIGKINNDSDVSINGDISFSASGSLIIHCNTLNLNGNITGTPVNGFSVEIYCKNPLINITGTKTITTNSLFAIYAPTTGFITDLNFPISNLTTAQQHLYLGGSNNNKNIHFNTDISTTGAIALTGDKIYLNGSLNNTNTAHGINLTTNELIISSPRTISTSKTFSLFQKTAFVSNIVFPISNLTVSCNGISIGTLSNTKNITIMTDLSYTAGDIRLYGANLYINGSLNTVLAGSLGDISLKGIVTVAPGKYIKCGRNFTQNGNITFKSDATGTAMFGTLGGTYGRTSGTVTVERYIPVGKRAFRLLSPAVTTTSYISGNWQQQTHITGGASGGFDVTETNNPSMFTYNNQVASGTGWTAIANTNATNLTAGVGYRVLVRGDRTDTNITAATTNAMNAAITLSATGTLKTGTVTLNSSSTPSINNTSNTTTADYSLVGNPYQSAVDWNAVTKAGIDATYWAWDPNMGTTAQRGRYVSFNGTVNSVDGVGGPSNVGQFIQPGQAFFVKNTTSGTAGTLTFEEAHKATTSANVFRNANQTESANLTSLSVQLYDPNELAIGAYPIDATKAVFNTEYTNELGLGDAAKLEAAGENIAWYRNNTKLAIDAAAPVTTSDELAMKTLRLGANKNYTFKINTTNFDTDLTPYLVDNFLNTQTQISTSEVYLANFSTTSNVASYGEDRFKIVFQNSTLDNDDFANNIKLYPNPAKAGGSFYIDGITEATVSVYNVVGQTIPVTVMSQGNAVQVTPTAVLSQGVYLVTVTTAGKTAQVKWIVE
jgi:autotransporter-associated beta strand protein